jgi:hypothetical protein
VVAERHGHIAAYATAVGFFGHAVGQSNAVKFSTDPQFSMRAASCSAEITRKRIRRGTFRSVRDLVQAIQEYIRENNKSPRPFQWVASANTIVRKIRKYKWTLETGD